MENCRVHSTAILRGRSIGALFTGMGRGLSVDVAHEGKLRLVLSQTPMRCVTRRVRAASCVTLVPGLGCASGLDEKRMQLPQKTPGTLVCIQAAYTAHHLSDGTVRHDGFRQCLVTGLEIRDPNDYNASNPSNTYTYAF